MATTLVSPGVSVEIIDQSFYASNGPGTVPFILMATRENKTNPSGNIASGTLPENAGKLYTVSSSRELLDLFGAPVFPKNSSGNAIYGSETAEYGLLAAKSILDVSARAYVMRSDVQMDQLISTSARPTGSVANGTNWLDTSTSSWGVFEWSATTGQFSKKTVLAITKEADQGFDGVPIQSIGRIGNYAVNTTLTSNPVYFKNYNNEWVMVGSTDWQNSWPAVSSPNYNPTLSNGSSININGYTVTLTGTTITNLASRINAKNIPGIYADATSGYLELYITSDSSSESTIDGKAHITDELTGTTLSALGLTAGYFGSPAVSLGPHTQVPQWKSFDTTPRPTGSIWVKTTSISGGANLQLNRWSSNSNQWVLQSAPLYPNDETALRYLDPSRGGLGVSKNAIYVQYDIDAANEVTYKLLTRGETGLTTITGSVSNPTLTDGDTFTINASLPGSSSLPGAVTITVVSPDGSTAPKNVDLVTAILSAGIDYIDAGITATGAVYISHTAGGVIYLKENSGALIGTPLADAGITSSNNYARGAADGSIVVSYFEALDYTASSISPVASPEDGTMWYAGTPIEVDIMVSDGTDWKGYRTLDTDARGFDLTLTDPLGPIISASAPVTQNDGVSALQDGDIWINTSDLENYPKIYRRETIQTESQWVLINSADDTSENGMVFADARWDATVDEFDSSIGGLLDPVTDDKPLIADMLLSDYVDPDAPSASVYPRGILLFNTRRSTYNVKEYVANHFNQTDFPGNNLPTVRSSWVSISGAKSDGVPYFGRRAVRNVIVASLRAAIDGSDELREDSRFFNLMATPGYPELIQNMISLNTARRETAFIVGDLPMGLASDSTTLENYIINSNGEVSDTEYGLLTNNTFVGVYYPSVGLTNDTTGAVVAVPSSHMVMKVFVTNDTKAYPWFAPAGEQRGIIDNATDIGYINRATGQFIRVGTRQGMRDLLYTNRVNPIALFSTSGLLVYGQKTRSSASSALDRINVARLVNYIRFQLEKITKPLIFEPNDKITRNEAKQIVEGMLSDVLAKRGLYDYLVVCDTSNNTPASIDRNELNIDVYIEPAKAVEFIYVPVRILNTGGIKAGNIAPQPIA